MKVDIEKVIEIIRDALCVDEDVVITADTKLKQELEMDSLDTMSVGTALEEYYDITGDVDYSKFITVADVVNEIQKYVK